MGLPVKERWGWPKEVAEFIIGMRRKRHVRFAGALLCAGVGFLAVPSLWIYIATLASENIQELVAANASRPWFTASDIAGWFCVASSVGVFCFFERQQADALVGKNGKAVNISQEGWSLKLVLEKLLEHERKPVELIGFDGEVASATLKKGSFRWETLEDAVDGICLLAQVSVKQKFRISLTETSSIIKLEVKYE